MQKSLKFYVIIFLITTFFASYLISYYFITKKYEQIVLNELKISARMLADQILLTRKWVSLHKAVLVEKKDYIEPNPYLSEPFIIDSKGRIFIKMNPAFVTREISKLAEKERGFYFRVTSLRALNTKNTPDPFEKEALIAFEQDKKVTEFHRLSDTLFRYIVPLYTDKECLSCHKDYSIGEVRGGLSLNLSAQELLEKLGRTKFNFFIAITLFYGFIFAGFIWFFHGFVLNPIKNLVDFADGNKAQTEDHLNSKEFNILYKRLKEARNSDQIIKEKLKKEVEIATKELKEINDKKTDFFLEVGHKLKTPLTVISSSVDYLLIKGSCKEDERFLNLLKKNIESLKRTTNQILKTAQIDMGISEPAFEKIDLSVILYDVIGSFDYKNFVTEVKENVYISGDGEKLLILFENLIHNAIKFNKYNGKVFIELRSDNEWAITSIKDEGLGIKDVSKIFQKFYHKDIEGGEKGTGLGLYLSKKIVEMHKGVLSFNTEIDKGTTFIVKIPLLKERV